MTKKELRKQILNLRNAIPSNERAACSREIQKQLLQSYAYHKASYILSYVHFRSEVETRMILETALIQGKKLYCPKVCGKEMDFYRIEKLDDLKSGAYGILEPEALEERKFIPSDHRFDQILMVIPGAVFDRSHFRIGYGGGYYDRYLASLKSAGLTENLITAALLFSCQLVDELPRESHDFGVDILVTAGN
ncbi:MAG: 5-formyltetrahydrofolate cyclo-ligase [Clostridiales bacterium]|nr:5-formyltetrahydrofolate cyclo-ligase [Clostridiales bacterium]